MNISTCVTSYTLMSCSTKDGELAEERKEFESFRRKLQRQLTELTDEMDLQKREITTGG